MLYMLSNPGVVPEKLPESKTKGILFRPLGTAVGVPCNFVLGPHKITMFKSVKTLGVIFTEHMSWNEHVKSLCSKAQKAGIINRCRHFLPTGVKQLLYLALFHSHLNYCALVWANTTSQNVHKITILQKKANRAIENVPFLAHTKELFLKHRILKAENCYKLIRSYRSAKRGKLDIFLDLAHFQESVHVYAYRHKTPWRIPSSRTQTDILAVRDDGILDMFL